MPVGAGLEGGLEVLPRSWCPCRRRAGRAGRPPRPRALSSPASQIWVSRYSVNTTTRSSFHSPSGLAQRRSARRRAARPCCRPGRPEPAPTRAARSARRRPAADSGVAVPIEQGAFGVGAGGVVGLVVPVVVGVERVGVVRAPAGRGPCGRAARAVLANAAGEENSRFFSSRVTRSLRRGEPVRSRGVAGEQVVAGALGVGVVDLERLGGQPRRRTRARRRRRRSRPSAGGPAPRAARPGRARRRGRTGAGRPSRAAPARTRCSRCAGWRTAAAGAGCAR